jgi:hypothetical protein
MLKGRTITLSRSKGKGNPRKALLYSADLSAATDYIPHELGIVLAKWLNSKVFTDPENRERWDSAVELLLGPHSIVDSQQDFGGIFEPRVRRAEPKFSNTLECYIDALEGSKSHETSRGLHMGLGPSWVILSLINLAAAWLAAPEHRNSAAVCGDDLIALWTPEEVERYESTLTALGLVVNRSKSFYGPRGVFCEQVVERKNSWSAQSRVVIGPAEAGASKWKGRVTKSPLTCLEALTSSSAKLVKPGRWLRDTRIRELAPTRKEGDVTFGGRGRGVASMAQIQHVLRHGKLKLTKTPVEGWEQTLQSLTLRSHMRDRDTKYIKYEDARNALLRETRLKKLWSPEEALPAKVKPLSCKMFKKRSAMIAPFSWTMWKSSLNTTTRVSTRTRRLLVRITEKAEANGRFTLQDRKRITRCLKRGSPEGWVPLYELTEIGNANSLPTRTLGFPA